MKVAGEQFVVDNDGNKTGVILPVEQYNHLLEDLHDLAIVAERRVNPGTQYYLLSKTCIVSPDNLCPQIIYTHLSIINYH